MAAISNSYLICLPILPVPAVFDAVCRMQVTGALSSAVSQ